MTNLPGLKDPVHDAQRTFRGLLDANARPGIAYSITAKITPPVGLTSACAAACLTLLDLDVVVWLQPSFADVVKAWLVFHTGCRLTQQPQEADFALIQDLATSPALSSFSLGTAEQPEASTTLLVQVGSWDGGESVVLIGPGILDNRVISPKVTSNFWDFWTQNHQAYPQGVDVLLFTENAVMGLPRTVKAITNL